MAALTLIDGVLRVDGSALVLAKASGEACCCNLFEYTIEICNSNEVTDDDWEVELNGEIIGTHSAPDMILAGTVWRTNEDLTSGCGQVTYKTLDKNKFVTGQNMLYMKIVKLYECGDGEPGSGAPGRPYDGTGCGNFGGVTVTRWRTGENGVFVVDATLLSATYDGPSEIGYSSAHDFTNP